MLTPGDYADAARRVLPPPVWDFIDGGSGAERTLADNAAEFAGLHVVPRVLRDVSAPDPTCTVLGTELAAPVVVAPVAYHRLLHPHGELATARGSRSQGAALTVGTLSSVSMEAVAAEGGPLWFQLYWLKDRDIVLDLVGRAERAGYRALVVTVDVPRMGPRLRDVRNAFRLPPDIVPANIGSPDDVPAAHGNSVTAHTNAVFEAALTWADIAWLREHTRLPLLLKGVMDPDDALRAVDTGVDGIVVSNHGGRQLDGAPPSLRALPGVRDAVGSRCAVLLDSGVRSGTDVLKAVARGADAVMVGRPALWGLAVAGADGVADVLRLLRAELTDAMALAGCPDLTAVRALKTLPPSTPSTNR